MFSQYLSKAATHSVASARGLASTLLLSTEKEWLANTANELRREAKSRGLSQCALFLRLVNQFLMTC